MKSAWTHSSRLVAAAREEPDRVGREDLAKLNKIVLAPMFVLKSAFFSVIGATLGAIGGVFLGAMAFLFVGTAFGGKEDPGAQAWYVVMLLSIVAGAVGGLVASYKTERREGENGDRTV